MKPKRWMTAAAVAALAVAGLSAHAPAQVSDEGGPTGMVADPNSSAPLELLSQLTPEELEKIVRKADALRLADERLKAADEIAAGQLYDESAKEAAEDILLKGQAVSQQDNIRRISEAFAKVERQFRKAYQLFEEGKYAQCAEAAKQLLKEDETGFNMAAKYFLCAEALAKLAEELKKAGPEREKDAKNAHFDAIEAYIEVIRLMPERISFAATAALKAGRAYEDAGRCINAMKLYAVLLRNYSLTMTAAERDALIDKLKAWQEIYQDASTVMRHLSAKMGDVQKRLAACDPGKDTQAGQREIVQVLEDLIKTIEEAQNAQSRSQGQGKDKKPQGGCQGECGGTCDSCKAQGKGKGQGKPQGTQQPSSPARESFLPDGAVARPTKLETPHTTKENDDWSSLPPTDRDKLTEVMKKMLSERYGQLVSDYHTAISGATPGRPAARPAVPPAPPADR